jgi:hypothetical protein
MDRNYANYCLQKAKQAVSTLATGRGRINERLNNAFYDIGHLLLDKLPEGDPQNTYRKFNEHITAVEARGSEGNVQATLNAISEDEARSIAQLIVDLEYQLRVALDRV